MLQSQLGSPTGWRDGGVALTEHLARSSKVRAPWVAFLAVVAGVAILAAASMSFTGASLASSLLTHSFGGVVLEEVNKQISSEMLSPIAYGRWELAYR